MSAYSKHLNTRVEEARTSLDRATRRLERLTASLLDLERMHDEEGLAGYVPEQLLNARHAVDRATLSVERHTAALKDAEARLTSPTLGGLA